jgi:hypothetical protein
MSTTTCFQRPDTTCAPRLGCVRRSPLVFASARGVLADERPPDRASAPSRHSKQKDEK